MIRMLSPKNILNHSLGVFFYLMLRNDWSWALLSKDEQAMILRVNRGFNVEREDYANPALYGTGRVEGGENWDSSTRRDTPGRGRNLLKTLDLVQPETVLEIGPGPGFLSRVICEFPSVKKYTAIELGPEFLNYLRPRLENLGKNKKDFSFQLLCGQLEEQPHLNFDFILVLSCVHHIPNRVEFFQEIARRLKPGGAVFCFDPSHYASRWLRLLVAMWRSGYLKRATFLKRDTLSTHHFCTIGEYKKILRQVPTLELKEEFYVPAARISRFPILARLFPRLSSIEMGVLLRKK